MNSFHPPYGGATEKMHASTPVFVSPSRLAPTGCLRSMTISQLSPYSTCSAHLNLLLRHQLRHCSVPSTSFPPADPRAPDLGLAVFCRFYFRLSLKKTKEKPGLYRLVLRCFHLSEHSLSGRASFPSPLRPFQTRLLQILHTLVTWVAGMPFVEWTAICFFFIQSTSHSFNMVCK